MTAQALLYTVGDFIERLGVTPGLRGRVNRPRLARLGYRIQGAAMRLAVRRKAWTTTVFTKDIGDASLLRAVDRRENRKYGSRVSVAGRSPVGPGTPIWERIAQACDACDLQGVE